jgi:hypothetical protein
VPVRHLIDQETDAARVDRKVALAPAGPERDALQASVDEHQQDLRAYDRSKLHTHGWVWLYLRRGGPVNGAR